MDFNKFGPELLKTRIARIMCGMHTEGFLKSGHMCVHVCMYKNERNGVSALAIKFIVLTYIGYTHTFVV